MSIAAPSSLNDRVRGFWEVAPCGTSARHTGQVTRGSREFFEHVEATRYQLEPFIHSVAQFTRHHGDKVLEVGVGAGTDHLQWARAGAICHGVDLTDAAIEMTRSRLAMYGFESQLQRTDAERLPFDDGLFDVVYSWGVIHHSEHPRQIIDQIFRVLKPGGRFVGMLYGRHSSVALQLWVRYGLLAGRPWRSLRNVIWHHMESEGTKAYTRREVLELFSQFRECRVIPIVTPYDRRRIPAMLADLIPDRFGWFLGIDARK